MTLQYYWRRPGNLGMMIIEWSALALWASCSWAQRPSIDCIELANQLETIEIQIQNLAFDARFSSEHWDDQKSTWVDSKSYSEFSAIVTGVPGGKARVEIKDQVLRWIEGAAPFSRHVFSVAYNGDYGTIATFKEGRWDAPSVINFGRVIGSRPMEIENYRENLGLQHTLVHCFADMTLSEALRQREDIPIERCTEDGRPCIRLDFTGDSTLSDRLFLSENQGYAIIRKQRLLKKTLDAAESTVVYDSKVTDLSEVQPGIWLPNEIETYWTNLKTQERYHTSIKNMRVNADVSDERFRIAFPPSFTVEDERTGMRYTIAKPDVDLSSDIEDAALKTEDLLEGKPKGNRATQFPLLASTAVDEREMEKATGNLVAGHQIPRFIVLGAVLSVAGITCVYLIWKRSRNLKKIGSHLSIVLLSAVLGWFSTNAFADNFKQLCGLPEQYAVSNCGLNVTLFALSYYHRKANLSELRSGLEIDQQGVEFTSFLNLKDVLEKANLFCEGYKVTLGDPIFTDPDSSALLILQTLAPGRAPHFSALSKRQQEFVHWHGEGIAPKKIASAELPAYMSQIYFTGFCLYVTPSDSRPDRLLAPISDKSAGAVPQSNSMTSPPRSSGASNLDSANILIPSAKPSHRPSNPGGPLTLGENVIEVGDIPPQIEIVLATFNLSNSGKVPYHVVTVKGNCSCFKGYDGDKTIPASGNTTLTARLDKSQLPQGPFERELFILTDNPQQKTMSVLVHGNILTPPGATMINWWPWVIHYDRVDQKMPKPRTFNIWMPAAQDEKLEPPRLKSSSESIRVTLVDKRPRLNSSDKKGLECLYRMEWTKPPDKRFFSEEITVDEALGANHEPIRIPVRGEYLPQLGTKAL